MTSAAYHHYLKRLHPKKLRGPWIGLFDKLVLVLAIIGPLMIVPQILKIWQGKNASGVSIIYWLGTVVGASFWLIYGLVHREKPIFISNLLIALFAAIISLGVLLYG